MRWVGFALICLAVSLHSQDGPGFAAFPGENGRIAFDSNADGDFEIYTMAPNGADQQQLTDNDADDLNPAWSPDGKKIAFSSDRGSQVNNIWVMDADGSDPVQLTFGFGVNPAWSPDGSNIAFSDFLGIWVMNADGSDPIRITTAPGFNALPVWSPDGSRIAFESGRDGNNEIYAIDPDGQNELRLTNNPAADQTPDWSPDSTMIAFERLQAGATTWVMMANGSMQAPLPNGQYNPAWSPDGEKIAFSADTDGGGRDIHVMDSDGSDPVQLTFMPGDSRYPDWQPVIPLKKGDLDCDGDVDENDMLRGVKAVAGMAEPIDDCPDPDSGNPAFAEMNCDGNLDASDPLFIGRYIIGLPLPLPGGCQAIGS